MADDPLTGALEHSPESVSIYDLDSTVVYMNPATERMMGASFADLRGKRLFELYPDAIGTAFHTAFVAAAEGKGPQTFQHYYPRFDGWFASDVLRVGERMHVYARDVSSAVHDERRLTTISRISSVLTSADLDTNASAQAVADIVRDVLGADCTLALLSEDGSTLTAIARAVRNPAAKAALDTFVTWPAELGHTGVALRERRSLLERGDLIARVHAPSIAAALQRYHPTSVVIVPLISEDLLVGALIASRTGTEASLTPRDQRLLDEVGPSIAIYLANSRRRSEAERLRTRLTTIADALPALVSFVSCDERYEYVNAGYERWFGGPRSKFVGRTILELIGPTAYAAVEPRIRAVLAGNAQRFRALMKYPQGDRHVDVAYVPVRGSDGSVEGFGALVTDISSEVRAETAERAHREKERRAAARLESLLALTYHLAAAASPDDIFRELVDGGVDALESINGAIWRLGEDDTVERLRERGLSKDHRVATERMPMASAGPLADCLRSGQPVWITSRADYAARYPTLEQAFRPEPPPPLAIAVLPLQTHGTRMCVSFTFNDEQRLTTDDRTYLEILASHGAEALRRADALTKLHDASELQATVIDTSPTGIMLIDQLGTVRSWNRGAERIFGFTAQQAIGQAPRVLGDRLEEFRGKLQAVIVHGESLRFETQRMHADGSLLDVEIYAAPVKRSGGEILCLATILDIGERKRSERAQQDALEQAQSARADAEAASRAKDEFLAMLGHELRNPLAPLVTALELMQMKGPTVFERERAVLGRQIQHLSRLVDDLLDVSRITRGKVELRRERVVVADVVAKAIEQTSPLLDERHHHVSVDVPVDLAVHGDATRLHQVIANLVSNAAKYTPPDGAIFITARREGDLVQLTVRDNGIGISTAMLDRVFDLFVQAPQSSERPAGGLGLGLTIVKSLVEQHGGTVSVASEGPGKGSQFTVMLPSADAPAAAASGPAMAATPPAAVKRVLVVDDNEDAAHMLADYLGALGHDTRTAYDGPSALRIADEFHPEVAVLDIGLPVMDGYELAARLRASPELGTVRLIAVTGYGQESDRRRSLEAGFQAHLAKPVEIEALVQLVEHRSGVVSHAHGPGEEA